MDSLSDRLKALGVQPGADRLKPPRPNERHPIERVLPGKVRKTALGETYIVETHYPGAEHAPGLVLDPCRASDPIASWMGSPDSSNSPPESLLFLDTETTGLAGGTGTFAFLVGAGRFVEGRFEVAQFFLREPAEEPAQLTALREYLDSAEILVTFNGKSFDLPLLKSRFITNGLGADDLDAYAHLDLLHLARRLWRDRLPSKALGELERHVLNLERTAEDVPGWMIPEMYLDYLRTRDSRPLRSVFYHNAMDIVSLAALLNEIDRLLENPLDLTHEFGLELIAIGRLYEDLSWIGEAIEIYEACLERPLSDDIQKEALRRLSFLRKRSEEPSRALPLWEQAAKAGEIYAHEELAKYFEHQSGNFEIAAAWTRAALDRVNVMNRNDPTSIQWRASLEHRLRRLERRLAHRSNKGAIDKSEIEPGGHGE